MSGRGTCQMCQGSGWISTPDEWAGGRQICPSCGSNPPEPVAPSKGSFAGAVFAVFGVIIAVAVFSNAGGWLDMVLNPSAQNNPSLTGQGQAPGPVDADGFANDPEAATISESWEIEHDCGEHGSFTMLVELTYPEETDASRDLPRRASADVRLVRGGEVLASFVMAGRADGGFATLGGTQETGEGDTQLLPRYLNLGDERPREPRFVGGACFQ